MALHRANSPFMPVYSYFETSIGIQHCETPKQPRPMRTFLLPLPSSNLSPLSPSNIQGVVNL
jgi:hypothetical protein